MSKSNIDIIAENLMTIHPLLFKSFSKPMRQQTPITPAGLFVLRSLKKNGIQSMSQIGKYLSMPKPHITVIVDKLIEEGYVERLDDPNDRRIVNIAITEKGLEDLEVFIQVLTENLKEKLLVLNSDEQEQLAVSSQNVKEMLLFISAKEKV